MARGKEKHASVRPSQAEQGGKFNFPAGSVVTVTEAKWTEWQEAGESALKFGRRAEDPCLKIVGDIEGADDPMTEFLGAGKYERLVPSKDGEYLDPADDSTAAAINAQCNANVFLDSICDKKKHGKKAFKEELLDDGISNIVGLKFVVGRKLIERDIQDDDGGKGKKPRPTLVAEEIIELPGEGGGGGKRRSAGRDENDDREGDRDRDRDRDRGSSRRSSRGRGGDEDRDDDKSRRGRRDKDEDPDEAAESVVLQVLELPKHRKGLAVGRAFKEVYNIVKGNDNEKAVTELAENPRWLTHRDRPWNYDEGDDVITAA